eukprot:350325-Amphidinium_carterae.1
MSPVQGSMRLKGLVATQLSKKRGTSQRSPLTVEQVIGLERLAVNLPFGPPVIVLGYLLFIIHARCRYSDA